MYSDLVSSIVWSGLFHVDLMNQTSERGWRWLFWFISTTEHLIRYGLLSPPPESHLHAIARSG